MRNNFSQALDIMPFLWYNTIVGSVEALSFNEWAGFSLARGSLPFIFCDISKVVYYQSIFSHHYEPV